MNSDVIKLSDKLSNLIQFDFLPNYEGDTYYEEELLGKWLAIYVLENNLSLDAYGDQFSRIGPIFTIPYVQLDQRLANLLDLPIGFNLEFSKLVNIITTYFTTRAIFTNLSNTQKESFIKDVFVKENIRLTGILKRFFFGKTPILIDGKIYR